MPVGEAGKGNRSHVSAPRVLTWILQKDCEAPSGITSNGSAIPRATRRWRIGEYFFARLTPEDDLYGRMVFVREVSALKFN